MAAPMAWEVKGSLELRNPPWHEFLGESLSSMRGEMVIASIAELQISLNKMVLVESRARLPDESQCDSTNDSVAVMIELDGRPMLMDLPRSICLGHHDHLGIL
jgi:hypothetical protein